VLFSAPAKMNNETQTDPLWHTQKIKAHLSLLADHLRQDSAVVTEPQAKALFETSAEVLRGLLKAFDDYEAKHARANESGKN
jgi:hypothetical protein